MSAKIICIFDKKWDKPPSMLSVILSLKKRLKMSEADENELSFNFAGFLEYSDHELEGDSDVDQLNDSIELEYVIDDEELPENYDQMVICLSFSKLSTFGTRSQLISTLTTICQ